MFSAMADSGCSYDLINVSGPLTVETILRTLQQRFNDGHCYVSWPHLKVSRFLRPFTNSTSWLVCLFSRLGWVQYCYVWTRSRLPVPWLCLYCASSCSNFCLVWLRGVIAIGRWHWSSVGYVAVASHSLLTSSYSKSFRLFKRQTGCRTSVNTGKCRLLCWKHWAQQRHSLTETPHAL